MDIKTELVCEAVMAACRCQLDALDDHEVHRCICLGEWTGTEPDAHAVTLPVIQNLGPWPEPVPTLLLPNEAAKLEE